MTLKITELFAFIAKDKEGNEGIMGALLRNANGDPEWLPFIVADIARVEAIKPIANDIKKKTGQDYEIRYFIERKNDNTKK